MLLLVEPRNSKDKRSIQIVQRSAALLDGCSGRKNLSHNNRLIAGKHFFSFFFFFNICRLIQTTAIVLGQIIPRQTKTTTAGKQERQCNTPRLSFFFVSFFYKNFKAAKKKM